MTSDQMQPEPPQPSWFWGVTFPTLVIFGILTLVTVLFGLDVPLLKAIENTNAQTTPLGNSVAGQVGFSSLYLLLTVGTTFGLGAVLVRKKLTRERWAFTLAVILGILEFFLALEVFWYLPLTYIFALVIVTFGLFFYSLIQAKGINNKHRLARLPFIVLFTTGAGITFVLALPLYALIALPIGYSIWDIIAVLHPRGPMLKVASNLPDKMAPLLMIRLGQRTVGLGDLMFYSLMTALGLEFGINAGAFCVGGIVAGVYYTLFLLQEGKYKGLPGLPLPMLCGFIGIAVGILL